MESKAAEYQRNIDARHLFQGQVVSLDPQGDFKDKGDAATWTGILTASNALRFQATGELEAYANLEQGLEAIHDLLAASGMPGIPARFVKADGSPYVPGVDDTTPEKEFASKDVFTSILFAYNTAVPLLQDGPIKAMAIADLRAMTDNFLVHDFAFAGENLQLGLSQHLDFNAGPTLPWVLHLGRENPDALRELGDGLLSLKNTAQTEYLAFGIFLLAHNARRTADNWHNPGFWAPYYDRNDRWYSPEYEHKITTIRRTMTQEDFYAINRFLMDVYEVLFSLTQSGAALDTPAKVRMRDFFDDFFTAYEARGDQMAVVERHWRGGLTDYLNVVVRTMKDIPQGLFSLVHVLAIELGVSPDDFFNDAHANAAVGTLEASASHTPSRFFLWDLGTPGEQDHVLAQLGVTAEAVSEASASSIFRKVREVMERLSSQITKFLDESVIIKVPSDAIDPLAKMLLQRWFANDRVNRAILEEYTSTLPDHLASPEDLNVIPGQHLLQLHVLSVAANVTGDPAYALAYEQQKADLLGPAVVWTDAGDDIVRRILGDDAVHALNVKGTHHLSWIAAYDLLANERDGAAASTYRQILNKLFLPIRGDLNSFANFIHYTFADPAHRTTEAARQGIDSLIGFPRYGAPDFDYTDDPSDSDTVNREFGGYGLMLPGIEVGSRNAIPTDRRTRDNFAWQRSPRKLSNHQPAGYMFPGVDYLVAYWMGRAHGVIRSTGPIVSWTGQGRDFDWNNPLNWSSFTVPGPSDDVVILAPGNLTITHGAGVSSIRSLTSQEAIVVSGGSSLSIGNAASISKTLTVVGAVVEFGGTANIGELYVTGASGAAVLQGSGTVTVSGLFTWGGGATLAGLGQLIAHGGMALIDGGAKRLVGRSLLNYGTATWASGAFQLFDGATLTNMAGATFVVQNVPALAHGGGAVPAFINQGTFHKAGSGTTQIEVGFHNTGPVRIEAGAALRFSGGGGSTGSFLVAATTAAPAGLLFDGRPFTIGGSVSLAEGAEMSFRGGTHTVTGTITLPSGALLAVVAGSVSFTSPSSLSGVGTASFRNYGGTTTFAGLYAVGHTSIVQSQVVFNNTASSGSLYIAHDVCAGEVLLAGTGTLTVTGQATWLSGFLTGPGQLIVQGGIHFVGPDAKVVREGATLVVNGTATWSDGRLVFENDAHLENHGLFVIQSDQPMVGDTASSFVNGAGAAVRKAAGSSTTQIEVAFLNDGTVRVEESAALRFIGGGSSTGSVIVASPLAAPSGLLFDGRPFSLSGPVALAPGAELSFRGSTHTVTGAVALSAGATLSVIAGSLTFTATSSVSGPGSVLFRNYGGSTTIAGGYVVGHTSIVQTQTYFNNTSMATTGTLFFGHDLSAGGLAGAGNVTVTGLLTWSSGYVSGSGQLIAQGGIRFINPDGKFLQEGRSLVNHGSATWSGGPLVFEQGARLENHGRFVVQTDQRMISGDTTSRFENHSGATFLKVAGTGTTPIEATFQNAGTVRIEEGAALRLSGGGTNSGSFIVAAGAGLLFDGRPFIINGLVTLAAGAELSFRGGTHTLNGSVTLAAGSALSFVGGTHTLSPTSSVSGEGSVLFRNYGGSTTIAGTYGVGHTSIVQTQAFFTNSGMATTGTLYFGHDLCAGELAGTGNVAVTGPLTWSSGYVSGRGLLIALGGIHFVNPDTKVLREGRTLINFGTATWSAGNLLFEQGARLENYGTFVVQSDQRMASGDATPRFENHSGATFRKAAGTGTTPIEVAFQNAGTVRIEEGAGLRLSGGGSSTGSWTVAAGAGVLLDGRASTLDGAVTLAPGAELSFRGGSHTLNGSVSMAAGAVLGLVAGTQTINGVITLAAGSDLAFVGGTHTLSPTSSVSGPGTVLFRSYGGSTTIAGDYNVGHTSIVQTQAFFNNTRMATTGSLYIGHENSGGGLEGSGNVTVTGPFTWSGGGAAAGYTVLGGTGQLIAQGGIALIGGGTKRLVGRTLVNHEAATWSGGTFQLFDGATFTNLPGATFEVQNVPALAHGGGAVPAFNNHGTLRKAGTGTTQIETVFTNSGIVRVEEGGSLRLLGGGTSSGTIFVAPTARLHLGGNHALVAGTIVGGGFVDIGADAIVSTGRDIFVQAHVTNAGRLDLGGRGEVGALSIYGTYTQTATGVLSLDIGGLRPGVDHDYLFIDGAAALSGELDLSQLNSFCPVPGDLIGLLSTSGGLSGDLDVINGLDFCEGMAWRPFSDGVGYYLLAYSQ